MWVVKFRCKSQTRMRSVLNEYNRVGPKSYVPHCPRFLSPLAFRLNQCPPLPWSCLPPSIAVLAIAVDNASLLLPPVPALLLKNLNLSPANKSCAHVTDSPRSVWSAASNLENSTPSALQMLTVESMSVSLIITDADNRI